MLRWGPVILLCVACGTPPGGNLMCMARESGGEFCVPDSGRAANIDVKLQLKDGCTSTCDRGAVVCTVRVDGGTVTLSLTGTACYDPMTSCPAVCGTQTYDCPLPAMPDGTYTVSSSGQSSQQLTFGAGGSPSCRLP
jgi:hypothetical protein